MADTARNYTLRVMGDSVADIREDDPELWEEIERERDSQDSDEQAVARWLGGLLQETEDKLDALLPIGWYAKIEESG
jgi:hypothetical protein